MAIQVLITTPIRSLGELIQQALQETGNYRAELVGNGEQALKRARSKQFAVAIIDFDAAQNWVDFIAALRGVLPDIRVIALPSDGDTKKVGISKMIVDAWLLLPFYLPNLLDTLEKIVATGGKATEETSPPRPSFPAGISAKTTSSKPAPKWLQDVNRVAQHLTRLSLESSAPAALIARGSQLWAYAGQLPQPAADELARLVGRYWMRNNNDFARFIRLEATNNEYKLYATPLGEDYVLALAFETEMPFMEMRTRAGDMARKLSAPPREKPNALEEAAQPESDSISEQDALPAIPSDWRPNASVAEGRQNFLEDMLASMHIPAAEAGDTTDVAIADDAPAAEKMTREQEKLPDTATLEQFEHDSPLPSQKSIDTAAEQLAETRPTSTKKSRLDQKPIIFDQTDLESETATQHNLTYACVLIPRLPHHYLVGDLAERMTAWITQLSFAFDWRLEHLSIRPDYLHWSAVVSPTTSPGLMVDTVRRETSLRIFSEFPRLEHENPSGEFWTSGYLVVNGRSLFSQEMVHKFIDNVRFRQGVK
ncbi:MAG: transposase [Chloroflexota bacterium]|nr:transposase [Chloroflexota bacterium]